MSGIHSLPRHVPKVSVVMPVYNAARFVGEAISSILNQTCDDFELIVINDGSTDGTNAVIEALREADERIVYVRQENSGIVAALNRGLELCRGELVARMDADDISRPDRLERQIELMRRNPRVIACGSDARLFGGSSGRYRMPSTDMSCQAMLLLRPCFIHPSVMFRRTVVDAGLRYRSQYQFVEDYDLWLRMSVLGELMNTKEALLSYRVHEGQIGRSRRAQQAQLHVHLSAARLSEAGINVDKADLSAILGCEDLGSSKRMRVLLIALRVLLMMALRGKISPLLCVRTLRGILVR